MDIPDKALEVIVAGKTNGWKVQAKAIFTPRQTVVTATSADKVTDITAIWDIDGNWATGTLTRTNRFNPRKLRNAGEVMRIMKGLA